jgi:hypothetical protein
VAASFFVGSTDVNNVYILNADIEVQSRRINALANDAIVRFENKQYAFY